jgi:hypothetical protein
VGCVAKDGQSLDHTFDSCYEIERCDTGHTKSVGLLLGTGVMGLFEGGVDGL